ncbi:MAG: Do family serine endopeptidase [Pseudomonadota bacterium]
MSDAIALKIRRRGALSMTAGALALIIAGAAPGAYAQGPLSPLPPVQADGTISFADLVEKVSPAVVSIQVEREAPAALQDDFMSELERFFERRGEDFNFNRPRDGERPRRAAQGSGFFVDGKGHIVTNNHVVEDADDITVVLNDGSELDAELVGVDPVTDLAVLKVDAKKDQPYVEFSENVNLRVGDWVVALGNPYGFGGSVSSGIVSAIGRDIGAGPYTDFIQVDAAINRGNSGGPTFDLKGRVVGVNTAIISPTGGSIGLGFAIPADVASDVVAALIDGGEVSRGWLGVGIQNIDEALAGALNLKDQAGAIVTEVVEGSPADKAGLKSGDVITTLNGKKVENTRDLTRRIGALGPGKRAQVKLIRDGSTKNLRITLGERDVENVSTGSGEEKDDGGSTDDLGFRMSRLDEDLRAQYRLPPDVDGVVVTDVRPASAAARAGLRPGQVVLEAGAAPVKTANDVAKKLKAAEKNGKKSVALLVEDRGVKRYVAIEITGS